MAIIDTEKISDYCLNPEHPRGKHKARVFQSALGMTSANVDDLISSINRRIRDIECEVGEADAYGQRYAVDIELEYNGKKAFVRTSWIIKHGEIRPRLTTCFVK
jgi:hypothetical protein